MLDFAVSRALKLISSVPSFFKGSFTTDPGSTIHQNIMILRLLPKEYEYLPLEVTALWGYLLYFDKVKTAGPGCSKGE